MEYLIIFNSIVSFSIVGYLTYKYFPFYFVIEETFWCHKSHSIGLWMRTSGNRINKQGSSREIFVIPFRNKEKLSKWDNEMFHSGEYINYNKRKR